MDRLIVVGAGTMGKGIALCAAQYGYPVTMILRNPGSIARTMEELEQTLVNAVTRHKLTQEDKEMILMRIKLTDNLPEPAGVQMVIEAIVENMVEKQSLFLRLSRHFPESTILASTTLSLSITGIAARSNHPERCVGLHFFNPVPVMRLVEVVKGTHTSEQAYSTAMLFAESLGKTPVSVNDNTGFIVSRLLVPMINEAAFLFGESVANAKDIDLAMKLGANHPEGPLALGDRIGLDVCLNVLEILFEDTRDCKYRPAPVLKKLVRAGLLGKKSGHGFYVYS